MSAKGGITDGKSHKEGGIPMVVKSTGQKVELEGGEGVINKRNMASEKTYEFEGQEKTICEIASEINSADGNGVKIDCDNITGKQYKYNNGGKVFSNELQEEQFAEWMADGNVTRNQDGTYSTQDALYRNRLKNLTELKQYFYNEFIKGQYDEYADGGKVRELTLSDAVLYKNKTWYITDKNGVIGIANYSSGAWGSDFPFIALDNIDVDEELTDMYGNKIKISYDKEKYIKNQFSRDYDEMLKYDTPDKIAEVYDLDIRDGRSDYEMKMDFINAMWKTYPYKMARGGRMPNPKPIGTSSEDLHTATMSMGGYEEASAVGMTEFKEGGDIKKGTKTEMEHKSTINKIKRSDISTKQVARMIAKDHLKEDKDYYKKLDVIENSTLTEILNAQEKIKRNRKEKRKYALGGGLFTQPHRVHLVFNKKIQTPIYTFDGDYDGEAEFEPNLIVPMNFISNRGTKTELGFLGSEKYILVPNEVITIKGYDVSFAGGGEVKQYKGYENLLSETDIEAMNMLRSSNSFKKYEDYTIGQKTILASFKGTNVVNQLDSLMITKLYGLLFQQHSIEFPIRKLYIANAGVGNILNQAPRYLEKIVVRFEKNEFQNIEDEICQIINLESYSKQWNNYSLEHYTDVDAMIYCYPKTNPEYEIVNQEVQHHKHLRVAIMIAEFSSKELMYEYRKRLSSIYTKKGDGAKVVLEYVINKGITDKGNCSLIYVVKK